MTEKIIIGKILSPHGIRGALKVELLTDFPERFEKGASVWSEKLKKELQIASVQEHGGVLLLTFSGIEDRTAAEQLVNSYLLIDETQLKPLTEGRYYHFQLVGLTVFDRQSGVKIGELSEVLAYSANDVYVVKREGKQDLLLPALKRVVNSIDLAERRMDVTIPEGLE